MAPRKPSQNADKKTGTIKPPVLDVKARSEGTKQAENTAKTAPKDPTPEAKKRPNTAAMPISGTILGAALVGVLGGFALAYGVALVGLWPQIAPPKDDTPAEIAALSQSLQTLGTQQNESQTRQDATNSELSKNIADTQVQLNALKTSINALNADVTALKDQPETPTLSQEALDDLRTQLSTRIDAISAGAAPEEAEQLAQKLATSEQTIAAFADRLKTLETTQAAQGAQIAQTQTQAEVQAQQVQRPRALADLQAALVTGQPFDAELKALVQNLTAEGAPETPIPADLLQAAQSGLPTPAAIAKDLDKTIPDLLAAIPTPLDASWQDRALAQARALLALRPIGEVSGNTPEAQIARLEAALAAQDFIKAQAITATMPEDMRALMPDILAQIATHANVASFIARLQTAGADAQ
jgi:hypothetical protein